jgi:hypothetical protein
MQLLPHRLLRADAVSDVPTPDELFNLARSNTPLIFVLDPCYIAQVGHQLSQWNPPAHTACRSVGLIDVMLTLNYNDGSKVDLNLCGTKITIAKASMPLTGQEPPAIVIDVAKLLPQGETP